MFFVCYERAALLRLRILRQEQANQSGVPPVYNLAAAVLQLIASRLYTGAETPYNPVILFILFTRAITKLQQPSCGHALTALLDACYIALGCELGFLPDTAYLVALVAAAYLISQLFFER